MYKIIAVFLVRIRNTLLQHLIVCSNKLLSFALSQHVSTVCCFIAVHNNYTYFTTYQFHTVVLCKYGQVKADLVTAVNPCLYYSQSAILVQH